MPVAPSASCGEGNRDWVHGASEVELSGAGDDAFEASGGDIDVDLTGSKEVSILDHFSNQFLILEISILFQIFQQNFIHQMKGRDFTCNLSNFQKDSKISNTKKWLAK